MNTNYTSNANHTSIDDVNSYIDSIKDRLLNYRDISVMRWESPLDNHVPHPRNHGAGFVVKYTHDNVDEGYALFHDEQFGKNRKLAFVVSDGNKVRPFYLAGWNELGGFFLLHPFPSFTIGPKKLYSIMVKPN